MVLLYHVAGIRLRERARGNEDHVSGRICGLRKEVYHEIQQFQKFSFSKILITHCTPRILLVAGQAVASLEELQCTEE